MFHAFLTTHRPGGSVTRSVTVNRLATVGERVEIEMQTSILRGRPYKLVKMRTTTPAERSSFPTARTASPWGTKITALAETARGEGYEVESVDYRGIESPAGSHQPAADVCSNSPASCARGFEPGRLRRGERGGHAARAWRVPARAGTVFPRACRRCGHACSTARRRWCTAGATTSCPSTRVSALRREYGAQLHLLDGDHRLHDQLRLIKYLFEYFLIALDLPPALV